MSSPLKPPSPPPVRGRGRPIDSWYLAALSLLLVAVALLLFARGQFLGNARRLAVGPLADQGDLAPGELPAAAECSDSETLDLGLGLTLYPTLEEAVAALGSRLWIAQPSTLPPDLRFTEGAFRSQMLGEFRQTTWSLRYDSREIDPQQATSLYVTSFNAPRFQGPQGEVEAVAVQGRNATLFRPGPTEDHQGVIWQDGCRWIYVVANLPPGEVLRIAEGIRPAV